MRFLHKLGLPRVDSLSLFLPLPPSPFQADPLECRGSPSLLICPGLLRLSREGAQGGAPSAIQAGAGGLTQVVQTPCLGTLLLFHENQVIQPLFSTNFPTTLFFPNLSLYF